MVMPPNLKVTQILAVLCVGTLLLFQNCAAPPEGTDQSSETFEDGLPLAFSADIDTISYMSCSDMDTLPVEKRAYYTFRASAYTNSRGGLKLTPEYVTATRFYSTEERARAIGTGKNSA